MVPYKTHATSSLYAALYRVNILPGSIAVAITLKRITYPVSLCINIDTRIMELAVYKATSHQTPVFTTELWAHIM